MPIEFNCDKCGKLLRTADDKGGLEAKCPHCGEMIAVPTSSAVMPSSWGGAQEIAAEGSSAGGDMRPCPLCGEQIRAAAIKCRYCGEDLRGTARGVPSGHLRPHRGGMILAFGIISLVSIAVCGLGGLVFGPLAWIMGNQDLRQIRDGFMDPSGESLIRTGKILGIIGLCVNAGLILLYCGFIILVGMVGAFNQ